MKKLLTIAALILAFAGFAEDQYLYWMISNDATLPDSTPLTGDYYAKISADGGQSWLNLYSDIGGTPLTTGGGQALEFTAGDSGYAFAGFLGSDSTSFLIELYQGSEAVGRALITPGAEFITQGGMSNPLAAPFAVSSFAAVPEPTSGLLLLLGVAGLALRRRKMQMA